MGTRPVRVWGEGGFLPGRHSEARSGWTLATVLHAGDAVRTERKPKESERIKWGWGERGKRKDDARHPDLSSVTMDPVLWIHGSAFIPKVEAGAFSLF